MIAIFIKSLLGLFCNSPRLLQFHPKVDEGPCVLLMCRFSLIQLLAKRKKADGDNDGDIDDQGHVVGE
jgi:hypothetical protein